MTIAASGSFRGDNALLAFAASQQGMMNEELSESMRLGQVKSEMVKDIADLKSQLDSANHETQHFPDVDKAFQAFLEKYKDEPACADAFATVKEMADSVQLHLKEHAQNVEITRAIAEGHAREVGASPEFVAAAGASAVAKIPIKDYEDWNMKNMLDSMQAASDHLGSNTQLDMIHMKQLNDDINNSSNMVSGIIESRQNTLGAIINNFA